MIYFRYKEGTRLGNWMFQYAAALSLSESPVGCIVQDDKIVAEMRSTHLFRGVSFVKSAPADSMQYFESGFRYAKIPYNSGDLVIDGYFQSPKYLNAGRIRRYFRMPDKVRIKLENQFATELALPDITSISVRRGDYLSQSAYHPFVGERYYQHALNILSNVKNFIVCSDDIEWCKRFFGRNFKDRQFSFSEGTSPLEDLYLISLCKNNIIANSSFSWWGAYLNENNSKRVIAPSRWFGLGYVLRGIDWRDIYDDGFEIVDNSDTLAEKIKAYIKLYGGQIKQRLVTWRNH